LDVSLPILVYILGSDRGDVEHPPYTMDV